MPRRIRPTLIAALAVAAIVTAALLVSGSDPDRRVKLAALGDSVTAGLESADGSCGLTPEAACESRRLSYAAVYAARHGIGEDEWANHAESGSTPGDWLDGRLRGRLDEVIGSGPERTFVTLGANPLVGAQEEVAIARLKAVYRRLLGVDGNRVVVVAYYDRGPLVEVNDWVERAVAEVQRDPNGGRLRLVRPPRLAEGDCGDADVSVGAGDTCIHPSAAGHRKIAGAVGGQ